MGRHQECLETYCSSKNQLIQLQVFNWISQILENLQDYPASEIESVKNCILKNAKILFEIDSRKASLVIKKYMVHLEQEVLTLLEEKDQLSLIDNMLNDPSVKVNSNIKLLHIKLLSKTNPRQVIKELKKREYPLDDTLKICEENNILNARAYLLAHSGSIKESMDIYITLFIKYQRKSLKNLVTAKEISTHFLLY